MNTTLKVLSGFIVGALAGVSAGILMAPYSGDKTRKKIKKEVDKFTENLGHNVEERLGHLKEDYNKKVDQLTDIGKKGIDKLKDSAHVN